MTRFVVRRCLSAAAILLTVSVVIFAATSVLPGDAATAALGDQATPERVAAIRAELGLDRPAPQRYLEWLTGLVGGDLGISLQAHRPVSDLISERLDNTLALAVAALLVIVPGGLGLGLLAGAREGGRLDRALSGATLTAVALPEFVSATALIVTFAFLLDALPPTSVLLPGQSPWSDPQVLVLPALSLATVGTSYLARVTRAGVADAMRQPYVETARLRGVGECRIVLAHAMPNALAPATQVLGALLAVLVGGTVVVETIFAYPGLGQLLADAVRGRDVAVVQSLGVITAAVTVAVYLLADLAALLLTPRARTALP